MNTKNANETNKRISREIGHFSNKHGVMDGDIFWCGKRHHD